MEKLSTPSTTSTGESMNVYDFFADDGPLAAVLGGGYRKRSQQVDMATVALSTVERGGAAALLGDAKTGTGKSLAYLVPAALSGRRAVVSTATKVLQHQLLRKELPAVAAAMDAAGLRPPTYALLKGRSNYLCQARHDAVLKEGVGLAHGDMHDQVIAWRNATTTGDFEDLTIPRPPFWTEIASDGYDCHRKSCDYADQCFYLRAKERVQGVDILVVNHHLLCQHRQWWRRVRDGRPNPGARRGAQHREEHDGRLRRERHQASCPLQPSRRRTPGCGPRAVPVRRPRQRREVFRRPRAQLYPALPRARSGRLRGPHVRPGVADQPRRRQPRRIREQARGDAPEAALRPGALLRPPA